MIRRINLSLFEGPVTYVVVDESIDDRVKIRADIDAVSEERIKEVLDWVGDVQVEQFEWAWAKFMAGNIAQQLWPDGNHRTSFLFLNELAKVYLGEEFSLRADQMTRFLTESKSLLQARNRLPGSPVFSLAELQDAEHPYRALLDRFAEKLAWSPIE